MQHRNPSKLNPACVVSTFCETNSVAQSCSGTLEDGGRRGRGVPLSGSGHLGLKNEGKGEGGDREERGSWQRRQKDEEKQQHNTEVPKREGKWREDIEARGNTRQRQRGRDKESERGHHTYVDFTENDVYYAANYDEEIKHIPGITKVPLHRMRWARGGGGWER